jgi:hypothetical protein
MEKILLLGNIISVAYMTGVIWLIQLVGYPAFSLVGRHVFPQYHASHTFWITPVVAPAMIAELATSILLLYFVPEGAPKSLLWIGFGLTLTVWASTVFFQIPAHDRLARGFDPETHSFLVNSNWIRTIAWSLHTILVVALAWKSFR